MKTAVLSTNDNLNYLLYLPYVQKAWNCLGWNTLTFYLGKENLESSEQNKIVKIKEINPYKEATVVQISRLFAHNYLDGLIMTSDIDMMPLSNYWQPTDDKIHCYGSDLTYYRHHPICYISATKRQWQSLIPETSIKDLLDKYPQAKSNNFNEWWFVDQDIITERIEINKNRIIIPRTFDNNFALGRIDRVDWEFTKNRNTIKIDSHLLRPFNKQETENLLLKYHNTSINE